MLFRVIGIGTDHAQGTVFELPGSPINTCNYRSELLRGDSIGRGKQDKIRGCVTHSIVGTLKFGLLDPLRHLCF